MGILGHELVNASVKPTTTAKPAGELSGVVVCQKTATTIAKAHTSIGMLWLMITNAATTRAYSSNPEPGCIPKRILAEVKRQA
jgi:hypothetical protein